MKKLILSLVMIAGVCFFVNAQAPEVETENPEQTEQVETTETEAPAEEEAE